MLAMCYEEPGRFLLCYQPGTRVKREFVTVTPKGLRYRKKLFLSVDKLVDHFKRHWNDAANNPHYGGGANVNTNTNMSSNTSSSAYGYRR